MSGEKVSYVRIEQREERRLREMETHFRAVQRDLPQRLKDLQREIQDEAKRQQNRIDERFSSLKQTTDKLRSDMAKAERLNQQRLRETFEKAQREYTNLVSQERAARLQQAAVMRNEYQSLISEERTERQRQIGELQTRVGHIESREAALQEMAEAWFADLRLLQEEIEKLPHRRFAPGRMSRINALIEQGISNLKNGASQAALVNGQNCYLDLIELRSEVMLQEQLFEQAYQQAWREVKTLTEEINAHRHAMLYQNTDEEVEFEVDFWSEGELSQIRQQVAELERQLEEKKDVLTIEQVNAVENLVVDLRAQMLKAVETAKMSILNSQNCFEVSQIVEETLKAEGFQVTDAVFEGEDQRRAYALKMRNYGGDEVVTIITPSSTQEMEYTMQMNFFDRKQDEEMRLSFARAVTEKLSEAGLQVTAPQKVREPAEPRRETLDFESFRKRRPASQAKNQRGSASEAKPDTVREQIKIIENKQAS